MTDINVLEQARNKFKKAADGTLPALRAAVQCAEITDRRHGTGFFELLKHHTDLSAKDIRDVQPGPNGTLKNAFAYLVGHIDHITRNTLTLPQPRYARPAEAPAPLNSRHKAAAHQPR